MRIRWSESEVHWIDPVHTGFWKSWAMRFLRANGYATTLWNKMAYIAHVINLRNRIEDHCPSKPPPEVVLWMCIGMSIETKAHHVWMYGSQLNAHCSASVNRSYVCVAIHLDQVVDIYCSPNHNVRLDLSTQTVCFSWISFVTEFMDYKWGAAIPSMAYLVCHSQTARMV